MDSVMVCETSDDLEGDSMILAKVVSAIDASEVDLYEPEKVCALDAPPKRFYRRSWTSMVWRLLESQRAAVFAMNDPLTLLPSMQECSCNEWK